MSKVILKVNGKIEATFSVEGKPKSEEDLLPYKEYTDFYYRVGIHAPVVAEVIEKRGLFSSDKYNFQFEIHGNAMGKDKMDSIIKKYEAVSKCEGVNIIDDEGIYIYLYSFRDNNEAYKLYTELSGICNIGMHHMQDPKSGLYLVRVEYHEV